MNDDTSIPGFDPHQRLGPRTTEQIGAIVITSGYSELRLLINTALTAGACMVTVVASNTLSWGWPVALFCGGYLAYALGLYVWERRARDILTALPDSVVIEHRGFTSTIQTIPMSTIKSVEVVDLFIRSVLRLVLVDGITISVVLGKRDDHEAIANWLTERLSGRELLEASAMATAIPEQLRNLRLATAKRRES
jgi:hypothetical protein